MILNAIIEKDDDGYFAQILELKGGVTQGNIYEEALFNIKEAVELYLITLENKNIIAVSIPKGKDKPYQTLSNQFLIRIGSTNRVATQAELM